MKNKRGPKPEGLLAKRSLMNKTKYHLLNVGEEMGCPNCGFIQEIELLCPEELSKAPESVAFIICWHCHYVGQIAVGAVRRTTLHTPVKVGYLTPEEDATVKADNSPPPQLKQTVRRLT